MGEGWSNQVWTGFLAYGPEKVFTMLCVLP